MRLVLTLVSPDPDAAVHVAAGAADALSGAGLRVKEPHRLGPGAVDLVHQGDDPRVVRETARALAHGLPVDVCAQFLEGREKRLLVADMDSTIIGAECLDELADYAGVKPQVAAITEQAMRGEIEFGSALRQRVALLRGSPAETLQRCYDERVRLQPGARTLVRTMAANGARCVLVSGGFDFFTERVAEAAGFHAHHANRLLVQDGRLTGEVAEPIFGRDSKLDIMVEEALEAGLTRTQTLAVGDGANDLAMIVTAGLGVAYRAKPVVAEQADARIDHSDLTALLYFQGLAADEFVD